MHDRTVRTLQWAIAVALALLLVPFPSGAQRWSHSIENSAHALLFALLTWLLLRTRLPPFRSAVLAALFGALTELAQSLVGRDASLLDFANDLLGIGIALLIHARRNQPRPSLSVALALMVCAVIAPLLWTGAAYAQRHWQAPVLWQQRSWLDRYFIASHGARVTSIAASQCNADRRGRALRVELQSGQYPGIALEEPLADWRGYDRLVVELANPGAASLPLVLRVHDASHNFEFADRYNHSIDAAAGALISLSVDLRDIRQAPAHRTLDLSRVAGVMLFSNGLPLNSTAFCLLSIQLR